MVNARQNGLSFAFQLETLSMLTGTRESRRMQYRFSNGTCLDRSTSQSMEYTTSVTRNQSASRVSDLETDEKFLSDRNLARRLSVVFFIG